MTVRIDTGAADSGSTADPAGTIHCHKPDIPGELVAGKK
jgi:hypothetical protein